MASEDETLVGTESGGRVIEGRPLSPGDSVGRYVVLAKLGEGGMGVVYAAFDPELDRRVALKLLHPPGAWAQGSEARHGRRLLREAQAMAKLTHPNVITVHDVGTHDDQVYLAMEHVSGRTLREAMAERPPWARVLEWLLQAGQGLSAAHDKGLVHRDFKPDNVMLDETGRVLVMDFGLAVTTGGAGVAATADGDGDGDGDGTERVPADDQTHGGTAGTPAYMAPEQMGTGAVDARADLFAFCVTLWEGLFGERPFGGSTMFEVATNVASGTIREPPRGHAVPRWLRRTIERGLHAERDQRWPSMETLLAAVERGRSRARSRRILAGVAVVAVIGGGIGIGRAWQHRQQEIACEREGASIEQWWPGRGDDVRAALAEAGDEHGHALMLRWLEPWAADWAETRARACTAAEVAQTMGSRRHRRIVSCLELERIRAETVLDMIVDGEPVAIRNAVVAVSSLDSPAQCFDPAHLRRRVWPSAEQREQVHAMWRRLAAIRARHAAGSYEQGLAECKELLADADALGWGPLRAQVRVLQGGLLHDLGQYVEAAQVLRAAYFEAGRVGADTQAFEAASELVYVLAQGTAEHDAALEWSEHATMLADRLEESETMAGAALLTRIGGLHWARGDYDAALEAMDEGLRIRTRIAPTHLSVASSHNGRGNVLADRGRFDEALQAHDEALAIREAILGPAHPLVANSLNNLAGVRVEMGQLDEARELFERSLTIKESSLGPSHPELSNTLYNLASIAFRDGESEEAERRLARVLEIRRAALGDDHPKVAAVLNGLGAAAFRAGREEEGLRRFEEALAARERSLGPEHPLVAESLHNIGAARLRRKELELARPLLERALAIRERIHGPEHLEFGQTLSELGQLAYYEERLDAAGDQLTRSLAVLGGKIPASQEVDLRFVLARTQWDRGQHEAAREQARRALELIPASVPDDDVARRSIRKWLENHPQAE